MSETDRWRWHSVKFYEILPPPPPLGPSLFFFFWGTEGRDKIAESVKGPILFLPGIKHRFPPSEGFFFFTCFLYKKKRVFLSSVYFFLVKFKLLEKWLLNRTCEKCLALSKEPSRSHAILSSAISHQRERERDNETKEKKRNCQISEEKRVDEDLPCDMLCRQKGRGGDPRERHFFGTLLALALLATLRRLISALLRYTLAAAGWAREKLKLLQCHREAKRSPNSSGSNQNSSHDETNRPWILPVASNTTDRNGLTRYWRREETATLFLLLHSLSLYFF